MKAKVTRKAKTRGIPVGRVDSVIQEARSQMLRTLSDLNDAVVERADAIVTMAVQNIQVGMFINKDAPDDAVPLMLSIELPGLAADGEPIVATVNFQSVLAQYVRQNQWAVCLSKDAIKDVKTTIDCLRKMGDTLEISLLKD